MSKFFVPFMVLISFTFAYQLHHSSAPCPIKKYANLVGSSNKNVALING